MQEPGSPAESATFVIRMTHDGPVLAIAGELDCENEACLVRSIESVSGLVDGAVLVDLTEVTMLSSAAIHGLLTAAKGLQARGRDVQVVRASLLAARVIELCGLGDRFHMVRSPAAPAAPV